jgi:hypothetical protein
MQMVSKVIGRQERAQPDCSGRAKAGAENSASAVLAKLLAGGAPAGTVDTGAGTGAGKTGVMGSAIGLREGRTILGITISHCG